MQAPATTLLTMGIADEHDELVAALVEREAGAGARLLAQRRVQQAGDLALLCAGAGRAMQDVAAVGLDTAPPAREACGAWHLPGAAPVRAVDPARAQLQAALAHTPTGALPCIVLLASSSSTMLVHVDATGRERVLGRSLDMAAGAALDTLARQFGMELPGGPALARLADYGDPTGCDLPEQGAAPDTLDFSFADLLESALARARELEGGTCELPRADLAASVQRAVVEQLWRQTQAALARERCARLALAGGVTRNALLRQRLEANAGLRWWCAPPWLQRHRSARVALAAAPR